MRPIIKSLTVPAAVANAICLSQTPGAAGALTINGGAAVNGVATNTAATQVTITSAGNDSGKTFVITGTDASGNALSESITGPNIATVTSVNFYLTVTSLTISAAAAGAITSGFNAVGVTAPLPLDTYARPQVGVQVDVSGTVNWTLQQTDDDPFGTAALGWFDSSDANMVAQTVTRQGSYITPHRALRFKMNSGTGTITGNIVQSGLIG